MEILLYKDEASLKHTNLIIYHPCGKLVSTLERSFISPYSHLIDFTGRTIQPDTEISVITVIGILLNRDLYRLF